MSAREAILGRVRRQVSGTATDSQRRAMVQQRLAKSPRGVIPERAQVDHAKQVKLFIDRAEAVQATVKRVRSPADVPKAVSSYLRSRNLPSSIRMGGDRFLKGMPWKDIKSLEVKIGPSDGDDLAGVSHAFAGVAETGTLVMTSGTANPTTINLLPDHHIVVIDEDDITGDLESVMTSLRKSIRGKLLPRTVNLVSGPSRSADIEQTLILGAHGPRALHIILVGKAK